MSHNVRSVKLEYISLNLSNVSR